MRYSVDATECWRQMSRVASTIRYWLAVQSIILASLNMIQYKMVRCYAKSQSAERNRVKIGGEPIYRREVCGVSREVFPILERGSRNIIRKRWVHACKVANQGESIRTCNFVPYLRLAIHFCSLKIVSLFPSSTPFLLKYLNFNSDRMLLVACPYIFYVYRPTVPPTSGERGSSHHFP